MDFNSEFIESIIHLWLQMFKKVEPGTGIVRSVTLLHERSDGHVSPLHYIPELLGQPRRINVRTPRSAFVNYNPAFDNSSFFRPEYRWPTSRRCPLFVFENAKSAKKLEVLVCTLERGRIVGGRKWPDALDYLFQFQVIDM